MSKNTISIETIMDQAQVFASAWSLVGGPFDRGNQIQIAEQEKEALHEMLQEFCSNTELREIAEALITWHASKVQKLEAVLDTPADTEIRLGENDPIVLTGEALRGFRAGMAVAKEWFGKFPLSISHGDEEGGDE
ncbi:host nuclease inhibitor protein [Pseudomonas sp. zfem003]|uniref:host nuclease inhibitor protein n=1 Tax=Pseudomonas sp. zfem003 TaxID=3078198 RepID=UPI002928A518|nr:host nuclease inhibitor protein [Pseudomonas sp. zfem003]MDU9399018.1 host nuclease inhibitor protein [Pseudomonas sp. zfem003]